MEKVRSWCGQPSDRGRLKNRNRNIKMTKCKTRTQLFNGPLCRTTQVSQYQKKHSPTRTNPDHQTSFINFLHLLWSTASSMFNLCAWQSDWQPPGPSIHSLHFSMYSFYNSYPLITLPDAPFMQFDPVISCLSLTICFAIRKFSFWHSESFKLFAHSFCFV